MLAFYERNPATLSGGQRARVALLRTLLSEPRALLLDEPFAKLDVALRARFRAFVFEHARAQGLPTLLVTHDPQDAADAGGACLQIDAEGHIPGGRAAGRGLWPRSEEHTSELQSLMRLSYAVFCLKKKKKKQQVKRKMPQDKLH